MTNAELQDRIAALLGYRREQRPRRIENTKLAWVGDLWQSSEWIFVWPDGSEFKPQVIDSAVESEWRQFLPNWTGDLNAAIHDLTKFEGFSLMYDADAQVWAATSPDPQSEDDTQFIITPDPDPALAICEWFVWYKELEGETDVAA